jgi:hypothetical protein
MPTLARARRTGLRSLARRLQMCCKRLRRWHRINKADFSGLLSWLG